MACIDVCQRRISRLAGRTELLELLRLLARCSLGSVGLKPVVLANKLRISVRVTTPMRRPDSPDPGRDAPEGEGNWFPSSDVCEVDGVLGTTIVGASRGVAGAEGEGDADSTIHILCERVAVSLATVCASVE